MRFAHSPLRRAVLLLLYVVGVPNPHHAIGSAPAVAVNAYANPVPHARARHVCWKSALIFAVTGLTGAFAGGYGTRCPGS
jgi:uncharacterized membrane protein YfcA